MSSMEFFQDCLLVTLCGAYYWKIYSGLVSGFALEIKCTSVKGMELNMSGFNEGNKRIDKTLENYLMVRRKGESLFPKPAKSIFLVFKSHVFEKSCVSVLTLGLRSATKENPYLSSSLGFLFFFF